jgi:nucleoside-diphosphate-sugar epimerase
MKIAITGATGRIGRALICASIQKGIEVLALCRSTNSVFLESYSGSSVQVRAIGDLGSADFQFIDMSGCDAVVHCAGRAHRMDDDPATTLSRYRSTNVVGTEHLVKSMIKSYFRRIVFLSSIKAVGESGRLSGALHPRDEPQPEDAYGQSKLEAELLLKNYWGRQMIDPTILRPVLVHGPSPGGNLERLLMAISSGTWLPFLWIHNQRSLVGVQNLCDAILEVIGSSKSIGNTYHVADEGTISTCDLARVLADGLGVKAKLFPVPRLAAIIMGGLAGKSAVVKRLYGNLVVDSTSFIQDIGWQPRIPLREGLIDMARKFTKTHHNSLGANG